MSTFAWLSKTTTPGLKMSNVLPVLLVVVSSHGTKEEISIWQKGQ